MVPLIQTWKRTARTGTPWRSRLPRQLLPLPMPPPTCWGCSKRRCARVRAARHGQPVRRSRSVRVNRSRLRHYKADKLVYCHEALHLKQKMQKAGYKQKSVKWESDSDSDDSDDEADLAV